MAFAVSFFFALLLLAQLPRFEASHFRGGILTWKPNSDSVYKVDFAFRLAFRRSFSADLYCDAHTVASKGLISSGVWQASSPGYSYTVGNASYHCTEFSAIEDWSAGQNQFSFTFPHPGPWHVSFASCCWISLSYGGSSWHLSTTVNLTKREDTGQINSSPASASSTIIRVQRGCPRDIRIPMEDPDGDLTRCRWASGSQECGGICGGFPYANLDEASCTLKYDGSGYTGWYGVALILQDFPRGTQDFSSVDPFSKVGLQFLVQVTSSSNPCNRKPFFTGATPDDYACVDIAVGSSYSASLVVQHMDSSIKIVEINTASPPGMSISSLRAHYDQGQTLYRRNVTWIPSPSAVGQHIFCFKALDANGIESEQRCITLLVGANSTPKVILGTRFPNVPTVKRGPGNVHWSVHFDKPIKKPRHSSFVRVHLNNKEIYALDTVFSRDVTISSNRTALIFRTPYAVLSMRGNYFITMDTGAVVGVGCSGDGSPSPGFSSSRDWSFYSSGVCSSGYYLGPDLYTCVDVDECSNPRGRYKRSMNEEHSKGDAEKVLARQRRSAGCPPAYINGYSGNFSSPNYPYNYPNYQSCSWRVTVPSGYQVKVEFQAFYTRYPDYLEIYDGPSSSSHLLGNLTGYHYRPAFNSSGRYLWFEFYSDCCYTGQGFLANFTAIKNFSIPLECANYKVLDGADRFSGFGSGSKCDRYEISSGWYRFQGMAGSQMSEQCLPGNRCGSHATGWLNGSHPSAEEGVVSRQVCFSLLGCCWQSNYISVRNCSGFYVYKLGPTPSCHYRYCGRSNEECPSSVSGYLSGSFSSPNFPSNYTSGHSCEWSITVPSGYRVRVDFHTLELSGRDYLEVGDGPSSYHGGYLTDYYGSYNSKCVVYSSGRSLWFRLTSYWWSNGGRGFYATYSAIPPSGGPFQTAQCVHTASTPSASLPSPSTSIASSIQPSATSHSASFSASASSGCPSSISGQYHGSFSSPNYPNHYYNNQRCSWGITVARGYHIEVEFHSFDIEDGYDYLRIRDGRSWQLLRILTGQKSCVVYSPGPSLWFEFETDKIVTKSGFNASFVARYNYYYDSSSASVQCVNIISASIQPTATQLSVTPSSQASVNNSAAPSSNHSTPASPTPAATPTPGRALFVLYLPADCEHSCANTPGSFNCSCRHGYESGFPYGRCQDINECTVNNGGCSHHCTNIPGGYYCSCAEGQTMSSDNHTCKEPGVNVHCGKNEIQISLERRHFLSFNLNSLHLKHRECRATSINDTHVTFSTLLNDCGTTYNETSDEIFFWNEVQADPIILSGVVSRMHAVSIPFYCAYNKKDLVSSVSYSPRRIVFAPEGGYGNMTFMMDLYHSSSYLKTYDEKDYPVSVDVNQLLHVEYKVESNSAILDVFAERCWATPRPNPFTSPYYTFLENGCALDASLSFDNVSRSTKHFTIKAFRFFNFLDGYSTVYMHCELMACHVNTPNSRCSRGCQRYRRRRRETYEPRETPELKGSRKYSLSSGPIVLAKSEKTSNGGGTGESKAALIGGTTAASGVLLVVVAALAVLAVKYRSVRRLMNRNKVGVVYAQENARKNAYVTEDDMGTEEKNETTC